MESDEPPETNKATNQHEEYKKLIDRQRYLTPLTRHPQVASLDEVQVGRTVLFYLQQIRLTLKFAVPEVCDLESFLTDLGLELKPRNKRNTRCLKNVNNS
jgi:hypothetical protein